MKEMVIECPEGYEVDKEKSTFEKIVFKKKALTTYFNVTEQLFRKNGFFFITNCGEICFTERCKTFVADPNNAVSKEQLKCILAKNKLANVARYLNGDWRPDFKIKSQEICFFLTVNSLNSVITNNCSTYYASIIGLVMFKTRELAKQAIEILGEEEVKLALKPLY